MWVIVDDEDELWIEICKLSNFSEESHPNNVRDRSDNSSHDEGLQSWFDRAQAYHYGLSHPQTEQLQNSNDDDGNQLRGIWLGDAPGDEVGNSRKSSQHHEGNQSGNSALEGLDVIDYDQSQLLEHHDVDKGLFVGGNEIGDSGAVVDGETFLGVDVDDFLLLVVEQMLNLIPLSLLLSFNVLDFSLGREVVS